MSGPFGSSQWMYSSGGFYDFPIEQSLKFNDDDSSYLSWTPASAGNRKTFTFSAWVKRGNITTSGSFPRIFSAGDSNLYNGFFVAWTDNDLLVIGTNDPSGIEYGRQTSAVYRDTSAWYHIVAVCDTTEATLTDRLRLYVNGSRADTANLSGFGTNLPQNSDTVVSNTVEHNLGARHAFYSDNYLDGYLAEVNFIDGQALDPTSFGEFKSGVWIPKDPSGLTYGTNGFRLSFQNDTVSEGFNTVTYTGNGATQSINGLGFAPDLVWIKNRDSGSYYHALLDSVRGTDKRLFSNSTDAENTTANTLTSFDADGFTLGSQNGQNLSGNRHVAWCWDAGSGSPVSNTDGSITSTVKANPDYGFSIITYTGNGSTNQTVGHGLSSAPEFIVVKSRNFLTGLTDPSWIGYHKDLTAGYKIILNDTGAAATTGNWSNTAPTNSVFSVLSGSSGTNVNGGNFIAYAFHSVAGYSKVGSYSGSGSAGNAITTGFKPAFVMVKRTDSTSSWTMLDNTRGNQNRVYANLSNAESTTPSCDFTDTGFELTDANTGFNASGGTYIYLAFADTRDNAFWRDQSGNGNDWQPNNLTYQDSLPDSTTNNFAVWNAVGTATPVTFTEGNTDVRYGYGDFRTVGATMPLSSGKWYAEVLISYSTASNAEAFLGIVDVNKFAWTTLNRKPSEGDGVAYIGNTGTISNYYGTNGSGATYSQGDIIGIALDIDAGTCAFYKNGTLQDTVSSLPTDGTYTIAASDASRFTHDVGFTLNAGQDSSFAGNKPAQGNTDDNGYGDFYYAPPSGYLALCTANLPDPVIDPAQDDVPSDYFNTVLYTGDFTSSNAITGVGFQPDLLWIKARDLSRDNSFFDILRNNGANYLLSPTVSFTEDTGMVSSLDSDGFTVSSSSYTNGSGNSYVAWNWLAGNGTSSNTDGSISSTVSVNQKAGFSVVSWTGNGSNTAQSIGHGLGAVPSLVITKNRDQAYNWQTLHGATTNGTYNLNTTDAINTGWQSFTNGSFDPSNLSSTTFSTYPGLSTSNFPNGSGEDYIAYCFAEVEGYSKFGTYNGNGSTTDGPFIYCGFRPAFVMVKRTDVADSWVIKDATREPYNDSDRKSLYPNLSIAEDTTGYPTDFLSNGFKHYNNASSENNSGGTYIYMAFAENPFKYANAR